MEVISQQSSLERQLSSISGSELRLRLYFWRAAAAGFFNTQEEGLNETKCLLGCLCARFGVRLSVLEGSFSVRQGCVLTFRLCPCHCCIALPQNFWLLKFLNSCRYSMQKRWLLFCMSALDWCRSLKSKAHNLYFEGLSVQDTTKRHRFPY